MTFSLDDLRTLFSIAFPLAGVIYTFFATRRKDTERRFKEGSDRMDRLDARLSRQEQTVNGLPSREDIHGIQINMERLTGMMGRMEAVMDGNGKIMGRLELIVSRHEEHLLKGSDK